MTLRDLFVPNKFGTIPILWIPAVGTVSKMNDNLAKVTLRGIDNYIDLDTDIDIKGSKHVTVNTEPCKNLICQIRYLVPLNAENRLILNALGIKEKLYIVSNTNAYQLERATNEYLDAIKLQADGTAWNSKGIPVSIYIEDILYRLDLQGKLT